MGKSVSAQTFPVSSITYTTADGLCDNAVTALETDTNGFLWMATRNGLSRYDGSRFRNYYQSPDGLRSNWITDLERDRLGTLWISTEWGLCYYDPARDRFQYINPKGQLAILYKAPIKAAGNDLWLAANDGLWRVDIRLKTLRPTALRSIGDPQCIEPDAAGHLLIGTRGNGFFCYNIQTGNFRKITFPTLPANTHFMGMYRKNGLTWVATDAGLLCLDSALRYRLYNTCAGQKEPVEALMTVSPFPAGESDVLLCGSYNHDLYLFNTREKTFSHRLTSAGTSNDLSASPYLSATAVSGKILLGTETGLLLLDPSRQAVNLHPFAENSFPAGNAPFISSLFDDRDNRHLWLQTAHPARLLRYDPHTRHISGNWLLTDTGVRAGTQHFLENGNDFWLSYGRWLQKRDGSGKVLRQFGLPFRITYLAHAPDGRLCVGTDNGIAFVDKKTGAFKEISIPFKSSDLEEKSGPEAFMTTGLWMDTASRSVWVSSIKYGLFRVFYEKGEIISYRQPVAHYYNARNRCAALTADRRGDLWLGTMDGLTRFDTAAKMFYNYRAVPRKVPNYIYHAAFDNSGNLWCRSNEGVFCKPLGSDGFVFYALPPELLSGYLRQPLARCGALEMAMGYAGGLAFFRPADRVFKGILPVLITECKTPDSNYFLNAANGKLTLRYPQNSLNIAFAAPVYGDASEARYEYRMLGRDTVFKPAPAQQQLLYTNLPGGDYVFEVRGNRQGYGPGIARLHLTVIPPFRETLWARLLLLGGLVGLVYGFYRYRLAQIRKEQAFRNRIGRNLHDEMGATLSSINIYSEVGRHSAGTEGPSRQLFEKISSSSAALQESMSDIIWYIHAREATLQDVLLRLQDFAVPLFEARNIDYVFETDREAPIALPPACREHLYLIFKEALNNSLKYAEPTAIRISFLKEEGVFVCRIWDNGKGFDPSVAARGNGLRNLRERAALMKGSIHWTTAPGKGCEMTLRF